MRQAFSLILPSPAADAARFKSMVRGNAIEQRGEWTGDILQGGIEVTENNASGLRLVRQQRTEPRHVESTSPFSFSLTELNEVLNSSLHLSILNESKNGKQQPATASSHQGGIDYGLDVQGGFQGNTVFNGTISETIQSYGVLNSADDLFSILNSSIMQPSYLKGEPTPNWVHLDNGNIRIDCTTTPETWLNEEGILGSNAKLNPGWFSNVNWSDDDNDGWLPDTTKTITAGQNAFYKPDKLDDHIENGDPDLRKFKVYVSAHNNMGLHDWSFKLTFDSNVAVYEENTKAGVVPNNRTFSTGEMTTEDDFTMSKTLWLEGLTASNAFRDVQLHVEYVGGNIPMLCTFDIVNVTVFGVTQTGIFAGEQQPDNPKLHSSTAPKGSKDENGQISWDLPKYINLKNTTGIDYCEYFHDCMEMQGTVKPPRDANPSAYYGTAQHGDDPTIPSAPPIFPAPPLGHVTFEQHREVFAAAWKKKGTGAWEVKDLPNNIPPRFWSDDWSHSNFQSTQANIVTSASHIYFIDNPGYDQKNHVGFDLDHLEYYANFRNAAFIKFYGGTFQLSDWTRWHSIIKLDPKDANTLKRHPNTSSQDFGEGWIDVPTNFF